MFSDDEMEAVRKLYEECIAGIPLNNRKQRTLKEGSTFPAIHRRINGIIGKCKDDNMPLIDTANKLIHELLKLQFFEYKNPEMSLLIGYIYLKVRGIIQNNFSKDAIDQFSSIAQIASLTKTW